MTTVIRSSAMPGLAPPAAREVGPLAVRVDRHDRAVGRLAEGHPQRRVAVGRPDLDDPPPAGGQHRKHPPGVAVDDRDAGRLGGGFDGGQRRRQRRRERLDPVEVDGVGDPASIVLAHLVPSYQQSGTEIEARRQDRPGRDRSDVDVQQARSPTPSTRPGRLDRGPGHDQREDQPDDQAQPDEQRPWPDERRERRDVGRPGARRRSRPRTARPGRRRRPAGPGPAG